MVNIAYAFFVFALLASAGNVFFAVLVYFLLKREKKPNKHVRMLRNLALYYVIGMVTAIITATFLLMTS